MITNEEFMKRLDILDARSHYGLVTMGDIDKAFKGVMFDDKDIPEFWEKVVKRGISLVEKRTGRQSRAKITALHIHSDIDDQGDITEITLHCNTCGKEIEDLIRAKKLRAFPTIGQGLHLLLWTDIGRDPQEKPLALPVMILSRPFAKRPDIFFRDVIITKTDLSGTPLPFAEEDQNALVEFVNHSIDKLNHLHEALREDQQDK